MRTLPASLAVLVGVVLAGCPPTKKQPPPEGGGTVDERLAALRAEIRAQGLDYEVGPTPAFARPLTELAGLQVPPGIVDGVRRQNDLARDALANLPAEFTQPLVGVGPEQPAECATGLRTWDWRRAGGVTSVKAQQCGDCWDYSGVGAFESAFALRNQLSVGTVDGSEDQVFECSGAGTCSGGFYNGVFDYIIGKGLAREADYAGRTGTCNATIGSTLTPGIGGAWGYVVGSVAKGYETNAIASDDELKAALCRWGPLATTVLATPAFQAYTGGTFSQTVPIDTLAPVNPKTKLRGHAVNHGVVIVGWDDARRAWLIKNSWGTDWGTTAGFGSERGYMWIRRSSNNIGYLSAWVSARLQIQ